MNLTDEERDRFRKEYVDSDQPKEGLMGLRQMFYEEGRIKGIDEGRIIGIDEGRIIGIDEGKIEGIDEGIDEGITLGLHRAIESLLNTKFGKEGLKLMGRIREIKDPAKLDAIMVAIGTMSNGNLHDFQKRIDV